MYIKTNISDSSSSTYTPLSNVVNFEYSDTYKKVERLDLKRVVRLGADVESDY